MKKRTVVVGAAVLGCLLAAATGMAQETVSKLSLKIRGGYGSMSGGDLSAVFDGINEYGRDLAKLAGSSLSGEIEKAKWGPESGGELVYSISRGFGVGLGLGYVRKSADSRAEIRIGTLGKISFGWKSIFTAVPVTLSGYVNLQVASRLRAFVRAGFGYYFMTMNYKAFEESGLFGISVWSENEGTAKKAGWGCHGGFGLEHSVSGRLSIFVEAGGRYVNMAGWDVDNTYRNLFGVEMARGTFWYVDRYDPDMGKSYPSLELGVEAPSSPRFKNARMFEIGLSGLTLDLGIKYRF